MLKRIISAALSAVLCAGAFGAMTVNAEDNGLIFELDFNNQSCEASVGRAQEMGVTGYEPDGNGGYAARTGDKRGNYLILTNEDGTPLLAGRDEITITFRKQAQPVTSWWFFAAPDDTPQVYNSEHYLGILDNGSNISAERYNNSGSRPEVPSYMYEQGVWQDVAVVISKDKTALYIDGNFVSEKTYDFTLSQMLDDDPVTYIGHAAWGEGEWSKGLIDDIKIYDFAVDSADLGDLSELTENTKLDLPGSTDAKYSVSWSSSDESAITSDGQIIVPQSGKKPVTLTASYMFDGTALKRDYSAVVKADDYYDYELNIKNEKGVDIQDGMYGLFFEDINYAADGGLYAEMIENRSFEATKGFGNDYDGLYAWSAYNGGRLEAKDKGGLNENNPHYLSFTSSSADQGFKNQAYDGVYMEAGKEYNVSLYAKSDKYTGGVTAKVYLGNASAGEVKLTGAVTDEWTKYEGVLSVDKTVRNADFVITLDGAGTADFDMVSCMPSDAVEGVFRRDLAEKLKALNPGFLRFPGGCVIEGYDLDNRYNWKDSIGPVEERKQNWNRWSLHMADGEIDNGYKHYNQTYGMGFYEYFLLCEYLGAKPVPVVNAGMACQYQTNELVPVDSDDFEQYIKDALDLIEFANGGADTEYGKIRAEMGHPEPFNLEIMGVGNEQWQTDANDWHTRYERFERAIHEKYPDMKLIGTSGPGVQDNDYNTTWNWIREKTAENPNFVYAVDEHYYRTPDWFYQNAHFYDEYPREVKVFAGEYASRRVNQPNDPAANTWEAALSEAAYMTMMERNADVVYMACYAPLFARLGYTQWSPDMIWFDDAQSYGSPTYYVQSLYSNNSGDYTLKCDVSENTEEIYQTVSYDEETGDIIVKIANPYAHKQRVKLTFGGFDLSGAAQIMQITGGLTDSNSIDAPQKIAPETSYISVSDGMTCDVPGHSFTVMRIYTGGSGPDIKSAEKTDAGVKIELENKRDIPVITAAYNADGILVGSRLFTENAGEIRGADIAYVTAAWCAGISKPQRRSVE